MHIKGQTDHPPNQLGKKATNKEVFMDSYESQKTHLVHFRFARLSLVSKTILFKNHMKIQIFSGTFSLHRYFLKNRV
jgi:hypothetical protein